MALRINLAHSLNLLNKILLEHIPAYIFTYCMVIFMLQHQS